MFELKSITAAGVPAALKKAERYRLLGDSWAAESICRDVLEAAPDHQDALVMLVLSLADQFAHRRGDREAEARSTLARLTDEYKREYYAGIICERRAAALLRHQAPGAGEVAYRWLREAMEHYERAEALRPSGNDEAILRWNTCVRMMRGDASLRPAEADYEPAMDG